MTSAGHAWAWPWRAAPAALRLTPSDDAGRTPQAVFEAWCRAHAGSDATVWVGGPLLHTLEIDPTLPLDEAALPGYARGVFAHYLGAGAAAGALAAWRSGRARGVCLLHGLDLAHLHESARRHRVRLRRVRPWWLHQLAQALAAEPALRRAPAARLLVVEGDSLSALTLAAGSLLAVRQQRLDDASVQALNDWLAGEGGEAAAPQDTWAIGDGLAGGTAPAGWRPIGQPAARLAEKSSEPLPLRGPAALAQAPDFLAPAVHGSPRLGWAVAATGALVLATAAWDAWSAHETLTDARARVAGLQALAPASTSAPATAAGREAAPAPGALALRRAETQLQHPWGPVLAAVEAATVPGVHWLSLEHAAGRPELRLAGLAGDDATPLQLAASLGQLPGWRDVLVARLKPLPRGGVEFTLGAQVHPQGLEAAP